MIHPWFKIIPDLGISIFLFWLHLYLTFGVYNIISGLDCYSSQYPA